MKIDARDSPPGYGKRRSEIAARTQVIDARTGESVKNAVAIDTDRRIITLDHTKFPCDGAERVIRDEQYPPGRYILRDIRTGIDWMPGDTWPPEDG